MNSIVWPPTIWCAQHQASQHVSTSAQKHRGSHKHAQHTSKKMVTAPPISVLAHGFSVRAPPALEATTADTAVTGDVRSNCHWRPITGPREAPDDANWAMGLLCMDSAGTHRPSTRAALAFWLFCEGCAIAKVECRTIQCTKGAHDTEGAWIVGGTFYGRPVGLQAPQRQADSRNRTILGCTHTMTCGKEGVLQPSHRAQLQSCKPSTKRHHIIRS